MAGEACERLPEAASLARLLVEGAPRFFSRDGVLNSDGRRVLAKIARACSDDPRIHRIALEALRDPTYENIERLLGILEPGYTPGEAYREAWRLWLSPGSRSGADTRQQQY